MNSEERHQEEEQLSKVLDHQHVFCREIQRATSKKEWDGDEERKSDGSKGRGLL